MYFKAKPEDGIVSNDELIQYNADKDEYTVWNREKTLKLYEGSEFHIAIRIYERNRTEELKNLRLK